MALTLVVAFSVNECMHIHMYLSNPQVLGVVVMLMHYVKETESVGLFQKASFLPS